jgi:hypothetical protein
MDMLGPKKSWQQFKEKANTAVEKKEKGSENIKHSLAGRLQIINKQSICVT